MADKTLGNNFINNQVVRFILSAGAGFLVDISSFYLFYHNLFEQQYYRVLSFTFRNYTLSFSMSFFLGVLVNFLISRFFVFSESTSSPLKQLVRFFIVAIIGYFANLAVLKIFIIQLGMYPPVARISAALSLFIASFFVHKFFSFSLSLRRHAAGNSKGSVN